jgi:pilus assembly protein FimV
MQALMEMKSKGMADMQKPAMKEAAKAEVPAAKPELPKVEPAKPAAEVQKPALTATKPAEPVPNVEGQKPAGTPQTPVVASAPKQPDAADSTRAEAKPRPKVTKPIKAPVPEPSLMEKILGEPLYLAGGAGLLALLGLGGFVAWRKRKAGAEEVEEADEVAPEIPPMGGEAHAEELPAPSAGAKAASDQMAEEVDPVAEADIYIAYGRDSQAENILKEALQTHPERHEIHLKLLEIYHKRKDVAAFAPVAETLFTATGGQGDIWQKAARMGYQLDAANPRYAGGEQGAPAETDITASGTSLDSKLDLDLGLGQAGDASTSTDIDLSELTVNAAAADLDLSSLTGKSQTADLDLRTQVLDSTRQMELGKTVESGEKTLQMPKMDQTMEMSRTQEANKTGAGKGGIDFDLDLSTITGGARGKAEPSGLDLDVGNISLDATMDGKSEPKFDLNGTSPSLPDVDLSSISLDLDKSGVSADPAAANKDEHWYDVQTKFDLAKAYQEMGDKEGAREILREVMQEGDVDQKTAAQKVMEALV